MRSLTFCPSSKEFILSPPKHLLQIFPLAPREAIRSYRPFSSTKEQLKVGAETPLAAVFRLIAVYHIWSDVNNLNGGIGSGIDASVLTTSVVADVWS